MRIEPALIEEVAKDLYIRALKILPDDVKRGFASLAQGETMAKAREVLGSMIQNIAVAEATDNLLCQDTGIPIYNVTLGRDVDIDGPALKAAIRKAPRSRRSCRKRSTSSASGRRAWAGARPRSASTSKWRRRTSR